MRTKLILLLNICAPLVACTSAVETINLQDQSQTSIDEVSAMADANAPIYSSSGPDQTIVLALASVQRLLKSPSSAKFKNVRIVDFSGGQVVCGDVNEVSGFDGFLPFVSGGGLAKIWTKWKPAFVEYHVNAGISAACQ
jgi:hypothetical protein